MERSSKENWYYWGRYFGFPNCCIKFFLDESGGDWWARKFYPKGFPLEGTGYIPCPECSKKSEQELIDIINSNRYCLTEFPEMGDFEETEKHRQELIDTGVLK